MLRIPRILKVVFLIAPLSFAGIVSAQPCADNDATLQKTPLMYPMASDQYAVQYQINGGGWTKAMVFISYYGETTLPART